MSQRRRRPVGVSGGAGGGGGLAMYQRLGKRARLVAAMLLVAGAGFVLTPGPAGGAVACSTANVLSGSNFEIDANANLKVDGAAPCIDWLADTGNAPRSG